MVGAGFVFRSGNGFIYQYAMPMASVHLIFGFPNPAGLHIYRNNIYGGNVRPRPGSYVIHPYVCYKDVMPPASVHLRFVFENPAGLNIYRNIIYGGKVRPRPGSDVIYPYVCYKHATALPLFIFCLMYKYAMPMASFHLRFVFENPAGLHVYRNIIYSGKVRPRPGSDVIHPYVCYKHATALPLSIALFNVQICDADGIATAIRGDIQKSSGLIFFISRSSNGASGKCFFKVALKVGP